MSFKNILLLGLGIGLVLFVLDMLHGCAHEPEVKKYDVNWTRKNFCADESCPAFAKIHNYTLLKTEYDVGKGECVCTLMSDNLPDAFEVRIPIDAPADAPVDSL